MTNERRERPETVYGNYKHSMHCIMAMGLADVLYLVETCHLAITTAIKVGRSLAAFKSFHFPVL